MTDDSMNSVDIQENQLLKLDKELLVILLQDKSTGRNIIWASDNYKKYGPEYSADRQLLVPLITGHHWNIIRPRTAKSKTEQQKRVRQKAEVFTPSWVCNRQNNLIDEAWFGRKEVFNTEQEVSWLTNKERIRFQTDADKTWTDYVELDRLEVSCGEAPYITSRYDAVTGDFIAVPDRIGILDRKLRAVTENTESKDDWLDWADRAVKSVYGFDWQGDNVLLARENVLFTVAEHFLYKFNSELPVQDLLGFAKVIAWNIWQMDGLKFVVPNSCCTETRTEETLFETITHSTECEGCKKGDNRKHNGIYCRIKDWKTNKILRFVDMVMEEK